MPALAPVELESAQLSWVGRLVGRPRSWVTLMALLGGVPLVSGLTRHPPPRVALTLVRPAFDLADRQGARFTEAQLPGHVWVVAFVEPTCLACAERVADAMAELGHRTRNLWPMFGLLTVALGPVLPGPEAGTGALRASRLLEGPDAPGLRTALAEGDPDQATALGQGRRLAVLDARGRLRARYDNDPAGLGRLLHDVSLLANRGD